MMIQSCTFAEQVFEVVCDDRFIGARVPAVQQQRGTVSESMASPPAISVSGIAVSSLRQWT
ncbi:MAG: hypothetical protein CSB44_00125 [Gammaproteobacteria bacterium]|nr:MAG: hypothetical protein CSB44_00125 [Gammaproteobacteria bacterium]